MLKLITVKGRFMSPDKEPIQGSIKFTPEMIWVPEGGKAYATRAPEVELVDGYFSVELTETKAKGRGEWTYKVECPLGTWNIAVRGKSVQLLRDLLPDHVVKKD